MRILIIFAQQLPADPISGGAGWLGAGLLGLVLAWLLMIHLPAKDKQLRELIDRHDVRVDGMRGTFETSLQKIVDHCKDEMKDILEAIRHK